MLENTAPESIGQAGTLYVIATPIGNLSDFTPRAIDLLKHCDLIACEDTRVTGKLLKHIGSKQPCVSYRDENETQQALALVEKLEAGQSVALVCDAGTPTISDPGFRLVRACRKRALPVTPIPGPCAITTALSGSGFPTNAFLYLGFLAPKSSARKRFFEQYKEFEHTIVLYESCHRIAKFIHDALEILEPTRQICIARELTKRHETFIVKPLKEIPPLLTGKNLKGEFVVVIAPKTFEL